MLMFLLFLQDDCNSSCILVKIHWFLWTRTILCKKFYMKFCTWTSAQFFTDNHNVLLVNSLFSWRMLFFLIKMWIQGSVKFIRVYDNKDMIRDNREMNEVWREDQDEGYINFNGSFVYAYSSLICQKYTNTI